MRRISYAELAKALVPTTTSIGMSALGFIDARLWERVAFVAAASLAIAVGIWAAWEARLIEPRSVRRRCHRVLENMARQLFPNDEYLRITVFVPDRFDREPLLVPIIRFDAARPWGHVPTSRARYRTDSSELIKEAWRHPRRLGIAKGVPSAAFETDDQARGWFQSSLGMPERDAKRLSEETLRRTRSIMDVALDVPFFSGAPVVLVSFSSRGEGAFSGVDPAVLSSRLETVAIMLAPVGRIE